MFDGLGRRCSHGVVVTEGLLIYLEPEQVAGLARDLLVVLSFASWMFDLAYPGILKRLTREVGDKLSAADAPLRFAPEEGPAFFESDGWVPEEVHSYLKRAARTRRLPWLLRIGALFPGPKDYRTGDRPWSALCVMRRK